MKPILPPSLKRGDTLGVIAPAGIVDRDALRRGITLLHQMGFVIELGKHVFAKHDFFAGDHDARLADLNAMIRDPKVKGIICARGGYGAVHLMHGFDLKSLQRHPKIIMGASDITLLLNWIYARIGLITFHGPMVSTNFSKGEQGIDFSSFYNAVMINDHKIKPERWDIRLKSKTVIHRDCAQGTLRGGCLSLLVATLGTDYEIDCSDAILFLEDVNEPPYRIDRMLQQMTDAGKFNQIRGVVFGEMLNCDDPKHPRWTTRKVLEDFFGRFRGPVVLGLSSGHTRNPFITLPIGAHAVLDTRTKPILTIEGPTTK